MSLVEPFCHIDVFASNTKLRFVAGSYPVAVDEDPSRSCVPVST